MSLEIWTGVAWATGGYGGWAHVRIGAGDAQGVAGGDRRTTPVRMALTAAIEALQTAGEPSAPVRLHTPEPALLQGPPEDGQDDDLWDRFNKVRGARTAPVTLVDSSRKAADPTAVFVHGWAEFALNIARGKGAFQSAIPKPNLKTLMAKRGA